VIYNILINVWRKEEVEKSEQLFREM
jgi:pentatricopeptide repeat protein